MKSLFSIARIETQTILRQAIGKMGIKLPIESGLIESTHRHLIHVHLKRPGAAWLPQNTNSIAQLRVIRANLAWAKLWEREVA